MDYQGLRAEVEDLLESDCPMSIVHENTRLILECVYQYLYYLSTWENTCRCKKCILSGRCKPWNPRRKNDVELTSMAAVSSLEARILLCEKAKASCEEALDKYNRLRVPRYGDASVQGHRVLVHPCLTVDIQPLLTNLERNESKLPQRYLLAVIILNLLQGKVEPLKLPTAYFDAERVIALEDERKAKINAGNDDSLEETPGSVSSFPALSTLIQMLTLRMTERAPKPA